MCHYNKLAIVTGGFYVKYIINKEKKTDKNDIFYNLFKYSIVIYREMICHCVEDPLLHLEIVMVPTSQTIMNSSYYYEY